MGVRRVSDFYKMEPLRWDRGTDNLSLEQEAAYLRVCNAIYAADQPIAENYRALAGMWRCNERKAKRLLGELVEAGKVYVEAGWIKNDKAILDVEKRLELRVKRQLAGHSGGIESGKVRAKSLKINDTAEASGSTRKEEEKSSVAKATGGGATQVSFADALWTNGVAYLMRHGTPEKQARSIMGKWRKANGDEAVYMALKSASLAGVSEPVAYVTAALKEPGDQKLDAWGIPDAKPVRLERGTADHDAEPTARAANLPRVQQREEGAQSEDSLPFRDDDTGWLGGALPSLRLVGGGVS